MTLTELSVKLNAVKAANLDLCSRDQVLAVQRLLVSNGAPANPRNEAELTTIEIRDRCRGLIADGFADDRSHLEVDGIADAFDEPVAHNVDALAVAVVDELVKRLTR